MSMIKIIVYETPEKRSPYFEWLEDLDIKTQAIIEKRMTRIRLGNFGDCKPLKNGDGVCEIIFDYGPGYRIYYGRSGMSIIILLIGGQKRSQKRDIEKAKRYWQDFQ